MFNKVLLQKIYSKVDVEKFLKHYKVKIDSRNGPWLRMRCILPGHKDSSPSANLNVETGIYKCFVCGARSFFTLVKELEGLPSFTSAVDHVKKKVGFEDDGHYIDFLLDEINSLQNEMDDDNDEVKIVDVDLSSFVSAMNYYDIVKKRVTEKMINFWNLKYATDGYYKDRLIIPITIDNRNVSFCARDFSGKSKKWERLLKRAKKDKLTVTEIDELREKYECKKILYPPVIVDEPLKNIQYGSSIGALIFNIDQAISWSKEYVILVEGVFDAMYLFSHGFNAVAILGTSLTKYKRHKLLANFNKVYICLDNDLKDDKTNPGQEAAAKIVQEIKSKIETFVITIPPGKDPDECSVSEFESCFDESICMS